MRELEHQEQVALFRWAELNVRKYPGLHLLHAIANGGKRHISVARKLKLSGVKPGVPDIFLPVAKAYYHGLYIEMKTPGNKPTMIQKQWHDDLRTQGYRVEVCFGWEDAVRVIVEYFS